MSNISLTFEDCQNNGPVLQLMGFGSRDFSQIQIPKLPERPMILVGNWEWGQGRKKQISDSELHKRMRSPLLGMDTPQHFQTILKTDPNPTVSTRLILRMTQPSFRINAFGSGDEQQETTFLWQSPQRYFLTPSGSPFHLNLPSHTHPLYALRCLVRSLQRTIRPSGDCSLAMENGGRVPLTQYSRFPCGGKGGRQYNSYSVVLDREMAH